VLQSPLISVVIPVYNGAAFVSDAIGSVLLQEGTAFELIVIDDGSTDATPAILARYNDSIVIHRQSNLGEGAARNAAIPYLRGDLVLFLDADDLIPAGFLNRFVSAAREAPEVEVFHCAWRAVSFDGTLLYAVENPLPLDEDPFHDVASCGSPAINAVLVRKSAFARVRGFDPGLRVQADLDFCLRLAASGAIFRGVPGNVAIVRRRLDSISVLRRQELAAAAVTVLERHLSMHTRCPACGPVDETLRLWRRKALLSQAARLAGRLHLTGRPANWIGMMLALARRPQLSIVALDHAAQRFKVPWRRRRKSA